MVTGWDVTNKRKMLKDRIKKRKDFCLFMRMVPQRCMYAKIYFELALESLAFIVLLHVMIQNTPSCKSSLYPACFIPSLSLSPCTR